VLFGSVKDIKEGDRVVDRSVKTLLEAIANQLLETSV